MPHPLQYFTSPLLGTKIARAAHQRALLSNPNIATGISQLQERYPTDDDNDQEEPIFLLSAGWRSGSTLLQRLIMSDANTLIWGEPYDECGMIQALSECFKAFRPDWPPHDYYYNGALPKQLSGDWIANLFPLPQDLRKSHRAFFDTMFAEPAKRAGAERWGIKEVRLGSEQCAYLHWLYPKAKFVFLYRNPLEAYRSYRRYGSNWYNTFPDKPVFTPITFGKHWRRLMEGFIRDKEKFDALMIRYEDLVSGRLPLDVIEAHLHIHIDRSVLKKKVGSSERNGDVAKVTRLEKWLCKLAVSSVAQEVGYKW